MSFRFSGKACFSPMVPTHLRQAWIIHGGTMVTEHDFRQTDFFFCNGSEDPWVDKLLARLLIVRHARWIAMSVDEQFLMPIAQYILDGESYVPPISGPGENEDGAVVIQASAQQSAFQSPPIGSSTPTPMCKPHQKKVVLSSPFQEHRKPQKRPRDTDDSYTLKTYRIAKKPRTESPSWEALSENGPRVKKPVMIQLQPYLGLDVCAPRLESASGPRIWNALSIKLPKRPAVRNPHVMFWEKIRNTQSSIHGPLRVSAEVLRSAPEANIVAFVPGAVYEGKEFGVSGG